MKKESYKESRPFVAQVGDADNIELRVITIELWRKRQSVVPRGTSPGEIKGGARTCAKTELQMSGSSSQTIVPSTQ
jgi:hypothetical protein